MTSNSRTGRASQILRHANATGNINGYLSYRPKRAETSTLSGPPAWTGGDFTLTRHAGLRGYNDFPLDGSFTEALRPSVNSIPKTVATKAQKSQGVIRSNRLSAVDSSFC